MSNNNLRKEFERRVAKPPAGIAWSEEESHYVQIRRLSERSFNRYKRDYKVFCEGVEAGQSQHSQGGGRRAEVIEALEESYAEDSSLDWMRDAAAMLRHPPAPVAVPDWEREAKRAFWTGLEIGAGMGAVPIEPRWLEYIEKRKGELADKDHQQSAPETMPEKIKTYDGYVPPEDGSAGEYYVEGWNDCVDAQQAALFRAHNGGED